MLARKIITASVSGSFFAILLGFLVPNPFGETITSVSNYLFSAVSIIPLYLMYSFPVILLYGIFASIMSDRASELISVKTGNDKSEIIIAGILHVVFGLIFLLYSVCAALLFFITDRLLRRNNKVYKGSQAIISLAIPVTVWLLFMGIVWIEHFINLR